MYSYAVSSLHEFECNRAILSLRYKLKLMILIHPGNHLTNTVNSSPDECVLQGLSALKEQSWKAYTFLSHHKHLERL